MAIPLFKSNQRFVFAPFVLRQSSFEGAFDQAMEKKKKKSNDLAHISGLPLDNCLGKKDSVSLHLSNRIGRF